MVPLNLPKLKILSLGRNKLSKIDQLQSVAPTLQELWLSYNFIGNLDGVLCCKKLETLYLSNNKIRTWSEVEKLVRLLAFFVSSACSFVRGARCVLFMPAETDNTQQRYINSTNAAFSDFCGATCAGV